MYTASAAPKTIPFNSLFEMRRHKTHREKKGETFNSLFEMRHGGGAERRVYQLPFNSLFEMHIPFAEVEDAPLRNLSILYLRCRYIHHDVY